MISDEAVGIRVMLQPETIDPNSTVEDERVAWERAASEEALAHGAHDTEAIIAGVPCRWVDSDLAPADATVIVYTHGGGLTAGSSITHRAFASRLAVACRARVLLVDYRLLPEHPISAPIDDVVAVVEHVVSTGDVGADRLFLAGDSSGAALAIGTARRLRDRGRAGHRLASSACPARSTPR